MKNFNDFLKESNPKQSNKTSGYTRLSNSELSTDNVSWLIMVVDGHWIENLDYTISVNGSVVMNSDRNVKLPVTFKTITRNFLARGTNLATLEGFPTEVMMDIDLESSRYLNSLEGLPKSIGGYLSLKNCKGLASLKHVTQHIGDDFSCYQCHGLTTLQGGPAHVGGNVNTDVCWNIPDDERDLSEKLIRAWWSAGDISLEEFKKKYKGAIKFDKYDL